MHVIHARNVNDAYPQGWALLMEHGRSAPSRYGNVVEIHGPVTTVYSKPLERVLFDPVRDANPFFHFFEALWILAGRQDVGFLTQFAGRMREFSDNGETFHAAYGHRLRHWIAPQFGPEGLDQLGWAVEMLRRDPTDRRIVLSIWNPAFDLGATSKDIPCNDTLKFEARSGALDLILFNRSNDLVWGTYGANPVQFATILEYVAGMAGLPVGTLWQISSNYHGYTATLPQESPQWEVADPYREQSSSPFLVFPYPLVADPATFDQELREWMAFFDRSSEKAPLGQGANPFFEEVAWPLYNAHREYKAGNLQTALHFVGHCKADDWGLAAQLWLERRRDRRLAKEAAAHAG